MTARTALIINGYAAANAGDAIITLATADLLRKRGYSSEVATRYFVSDREFYGALGLAVSPPIVTFHPRDSGSERVRAVGMLWSALVASIWCYVATLRPLRRLRLERFHPHLRRLSACDLVVLSGGGYLYSSRRMVSMTLIHSCVQIWLARRLANVVLMMPQSLGPFRRRFDVLLVSVALRGNLRVVAREDISAETCLRELRLPCAVVPDVAFTFELSPTCEDTVDVAVVPMDWRWAHDGASLEEVYERYQDRLSQLVNDLREDGLDVRLVGFSSVAYSGQVDIDSVSTYRPASDRRHSDDTDTPMAAFKRTVGLVANARLVIGTRLHSCISALAVGVPAIHLYYQPKGLGTYRLLGMSERYAYDVREFDVTEVRSRALELIKNPVAMDQAAVAAAGAVRVWFDESISSFGQSELDA